MCNYSLRDLHDMGFDSQWEYEDYLDEQYYRQVEEQARADEEAQWHAEAMDRLYQAYLDEQYEQYVQEQFEESLYWRNFACALEADYEQDYLDYYE